MVRGPSVCPLKHVRRRLVDGWSTKAIHRLGHADLHMQWLDQRLDFRDTNANYLEYWDSAVPTQPPPDLRILKKTQC